MLQRLLFGALTLVMTAMAADYTCPSYDSIRQSSVDANKFDIDEFNGKWYI